MPKISKAERKIIDRESPYLDRMYSVIPIPSQQKQKLNGQCCAARALNRIMKAKWRDQKRQM